MSRVRVRFVVVAIAVGVFVFTVGAGAADAAISGGLIDQVCPGTTTGSTFTLTKNCGPVGSALTVPDTHHNR